MIKVKRDRQGFFTPAAHRAAFEYWRSLKSFHKVSKQPGMPSHATLQKWAKSSFYCRYGCNWHGWHELDEQISREVAQQSRQISSKVYGVDGGGAKPDLTALVLSDQKRLEVNRFVEAQLLKAMKEGPQKLRELVYGFGQAYAVLRQIWAEDRLIVGEPTDRRALEVEHKLSLKRLHDLAEEALELRRQEENGGDRERRSLGDIERYSEPSCEVCAELPV